MACGKPLPNKTVRRIARLFRNGVKYKDIAMDVSVPIQTVGSVLFRLRRDEFIGRRHAEIDCD